MALPGNSVEELIYRITVESEQALQNINSFRQQVDAMKEDIRKKNQETAESFDVIATTMKTSLKEGADEAIRGFREQIKGAQGAIRELEKQMRLKVTVLDPEEINRIKAKIAEVRADVTKFQQLVSAGSKKGALVDVGQLNADKKRLSELRVELANLRKDLAQGVIKKPLLDPVQTEQAKARVVELNNSISELKRRVIDTQNNSGNVGKAITQGVKEVKQETKEATEGMKLFGVSIKNVGDIAKLVFIGLFGGSIIGILTRVGQAIGEMVNKALEFSKATFQLEIGVRALRRAGIDLTFGEVLGNVTRINEGLGGLFSQLELLQGAAAFTNLIRDLGLARDQVLKLQEATTTLAVVNGRNMEDVQRTVALAISSGYTEGLQRLGVSINRLTIAEEANRLGFEGGYTALTEQQRALATYNLIVRKTALYVDDMAEAQNTMFGSIQKSTAEIENQKAAIGESLLPAKAAVLDFAEAWITFIRVANPVLILIRGIALLMDEAREAGELTGKALDKIFSSNWFTGFIRSVEDVKKSLRNFIPPQLFALFDSLRTATNSVADGFQGIIDKIRLLISTSPAIKAYIEQVQEYLNRLFGGGDRELNFGGEVELGDSQFNQDIDTILGGLEEEFGTIEDLEEELAEKREKLNEDLQDDLKKIERDGVEDRRDILQDYVRDIAKLEQDASRKIQDIARNLAQKLSDIDIKLNFAINEANLKFDFDVAEVNRKFNEDVAKAQEEYRQKELERERKFQEELLRLREDFLFELEDALRERDAKAVLRATRQFNLEKNRAIRENEANKLAGKEGLANELEELKLRREARIRELRFELEQRIAELKRNAQFQRDEAARNAAQDLEDLKRKLAEEKAERDRAFEQEKIDQLVAEARKKAERIRNHVEEMGELDAYEKEKLKLIADYLVQQAILFGLSNEEMRKVAETYFGEGGIILTIMQNFADALAKIISGMGKTFNFKNKPSRPNSAPNTGDFSFATGGAVIAKMPTTVTFGEVPELAIFAPLSELDRLPGLLGGEGATAGTAGLSSGLLQILLTLSPDLQARIMENTLGQVADIMFEVQRQ